SSTPSTSASQPRRKRKQCTEDPPPPSPKDAILEIAQSIARTAELSASADAAERSNAKAIESVESKLQELRADVSQILHLLQQTHQSTDG
ncbi:hypothetical protein GMDG_09014, partial [Pseudogymnoascus destructans 20631-21]